MLRKLKQSIRRLNGHYLIEARLDSFELATSLDLNLIREALGRIEGRQLASNQSPVLSDHEFKAFSQWGEDGILQFLLSTVEINNRIFVEFGVEDYKESNTRFLLTQSGWAGLVIDGDAKNIAAIKSSPLYWRHNLKAVEAFITKDNINSILTENGVSGDIGLLSVDIDGNDYWIWEAINVIRPAVVSAEYNFRFGSTDTVTIPYEADFARGKAHHSHIYFGASLAALNYLARKKGYRLVGCNSNGVNAFFVREDLLKVPITELSVEAAFVSGQHRESKNKAGELIFLELSQEQAILSNLPLVDVTKPTKAKPTTHGK